MMLFNLKSSLNAVKAPQNLILSFSKATISNIEAEPIINKKELDSVAPDDPRHYKLITNLTDDFIFKSKFTNVLMRDGKFNLARKLVDNAFYRMKLIQVEKINKGKETDKEKIDTDPLKLFLFAMDNCGPLLKIQSIKKGGISYQVPVPINQKEREFRASNIIISSCTDKDKSTGFSIKLARDVLDANNNTGKSIKKKVDIHKLAEANRAYAHFRWTQ